jgi:hypothetical protein
MTPPATGGDITTEVPPLSLQSILPAPSVLRDIILPVPSFHSVASISSPYVSAGLTQYSWSYRINALELNDGINFVTSVPEIENESEDDVILVPIDGDYPKFVRLQPREAQYTFLIAMRPCSWPVYQSRLAQLKSVFTQGSSIELEFQIRGMTTPKSVNIQVKHFLIDPKQRLVTVSAIVARPIPV